MKPIYITGHKNPDCDSIVCAIALANLKTKLGQDVIACRLGNVNSEANYLLKRFNMHVPELIHTAKCRLDEIVMDKAVLVDEDLTIKQAFDMIRHNNNKPIYVVDENKKLLGVVSISNVTGFRLNKEYTAELIQKTSLDNIVKTLDGKYLYKANKYETNGHITLLFSLPENDENLENSIVMVGNNVNQQLALIEKGVSLIIICGKDTISESVYEQAVCHNVNIIHTSLAPIEASQTIFMSPSIKHVMSVNPETLKSNEMVEEARKKMAKSRFRSYPVVNEKGEVINSVSRYHVLNFDKKRFILVDHNETRQSVNDIEHGEIVEIIDHHRFDGLKTSGPVRINAKTVGACSTLVAEQYFEYNVELDPNMAGFLLGGIVSDTVNLNSPTTTDVDVEMVKKLEAISGISRDDIKQGFIGAIESITNKSYVELLYDDFKEFTIESNKVAIGQSQCRSVEEFNIVKNEVQKYVDEVVEKEGYNLILVMFTDPLGTGSYLIYSGEKEWVIKEAFSKVLEGNYAKGIISRKKQVLPAIIQAIQQ